MNLADKSYLADKPCYPFSYFDRETGTNLSYTGITLRERLIIALASNPQMVMNAEGDGWNAKTITDQADAIIKEMEK